MKVMDCWILLELLHEWEDGGLSKERLKEMIANAPDTELERVVRCAHCINARSSLTAEGGRVWCVSRAEYRKPCDFCSDGVVVEETEQE